jgi:hypothetical protein
MSETWIEERQQRRRINGNSNRIIEAMERVGVEEALYTINIAMNKLMQRHSIESIVFSSDPFAPPLLKKLTVSEYRLREGKLVPDRSC